MNNQEKIDFINSKIEFLEHIVSIEESNLENLDPSQHSEKIAQTINLIADRHAGIEALRQEVLLLTD